MPSALRKRGKGLIFTPNISTGDEGVHCHQAIVPFLLYDTTTNHGAFNFTSLNDAILLPHLSAYSIIALITRRVFSSRRFHLLAASTLTSLVSYGVVRLCISPNELHCRTSFPFCLELLLLPLYYELDLSFSHLLVSVVTESSILT